MTTTQILGLERNRRQLEQLKRDHPLQQLFWECTLRCNMHCRHCGSDCKHVSSVPDMPLDDFVPVLDDLSQHVDPSTVMVSTVGGEPLMRGDLADCGRAITSRGFQWGLVTNGYLLDAPMLERLMTAGLTSLALDIDGVKDDHNWLRRAPESYDRAMAAIHLLAQEPRLTWDVITCVHSRNIDRLAETKQALIDAGVKQWRCFSIIPMGRASGVDELQLSDSQFRDLLNFIVATRREGKIMAEYACEGYLGAYEGMVRDHFFRCDAGITVASIRIDGAISGCLSIRSDYHQGNIYHDSLWQVWQERFTPYRDREWLRSGPCSTCDAFNYCQGNGLHLRDGDGKLMRCHLAILRNVTVEGGKPVVAQSEH